MTDQLNKLIRDTLAPAFTSLNEHDELFSIMGDRLNHLSSRIENLDQDHNAKIAALQGQFTQLLHMNTELQLEITRIKLDVEAL